MSNKGILGLLTAGSATGVGEDRAVAEVLTSDVIPDDDLNQLMSKTDALTTTGRRSGSTAGDKRGASVKADRVTQGGNIDNLLSELGEASTNELERSDNLIHSELSPMTLTDDQGHETVMTGSRDAQEVFKVVNRHVDGIEYCFKREARRKPDLRGKVVVRFTIKPDGTVKDVKILSSTLNSANIERCIVSRIEHWDDFGAIEPSLGDATFRQVYTFGF